MNFLTNVVSSLISDARRIIKIVKLGKADVQEVYESAPFGIDSNPVADMVAVYAETLDDSDPIIIGYINAGQLSEPGEVRLYSTDTGGNLKSYIWAKKDGTILLNGDADNAVRFSKLAEAYNELNNKFNALVSAFNAHTHILTLSSGTGTAAPTAAPANQSTGNINPAKINEVKTS